MPHFWFISLPHCHRVSRFKVGSLLLWFRIRSSNLSPWNFNFTVCEKKCENNIVGCDKMSLTRSPLDKSTGNHRLAAGTGTFLPVYFFAEVIVI